MWIEANIDSHAHSRIEYLIKVVLLFCAVVVVFVYRFKSDTICGLAVFGVEITLVVVPAHLCFLEFVSFLLVFMVLFVCLFVCCCCVVVCCCVALLCVAVLRCCCVLSCCIVLVVVLVVVLLLLFSSSLLLLL